MNEPSDNQPLCVQQAVESLCAILDGAAYHVESFGFKQNKSFLAKIGLRRESHLEGQEKVLLATLQDAAAAFKTALDSGTVTTNLLAGGSPPPNSAAGECFSWGWEARIIIRIRSPVPFC
jgi:hypothetical protein